MKRSYVRLTEPSSLGVMAAAVPATWEEALDCVADRIRLGRGQTAWYLVDLWLVQFVWKATMR